MPIGADSFGGLQAMLDLREIRIGVAIVYQRVQVFESFPDSHRALIERQVLPLLLLHEIARLMRMVQAIELAHHRRRFRSELPESILRAVRVVAVFDEIVPLLEALQRTLHVAPSWKPLYWLYRCGERSSP